MGLGILLVVFFSIILLSSTIFASFPNVQSNDLSDDNQRFGLSEIIPSFPKAFGSELPFIGAFSAQNDKPGPITLDVLGKDVSGSITITATLVWDKSDNTFSNEFLEIPRTTTTLRLTFTGDGNAFIDFFTINNDVYEAEDFDRTGGCGTSVVDGRTVADCDNVNDFVEYDLNKGQRLVETVELNDIIVKPGQAIVLTDVTDFDEIETVHVAANLPCESSKGPKEGPGNDTPDVKIIAGNAATGVFGDVIESAADDTGFEGPKKTCIFHDTFSINPEVPEITDIVLIYEGNSKSIQLEDVVITIAINGDTDRSLIVEALRVLKIIRADIEMLKKLSSTDFEFGIDSSSSDMGAIAYTIFGRCLLEVEECEGYSINKIVAPPLSNAIFFGLCVDHFNCNILQDQNYKIGYSVEGGFSLAAHGAGGAGADINGPIYPILPTNILTVSGLGETSVTKVITVLDVSVTPQLIQNGLKGEVKFVGERPIDMQMFGWYLDTDGFHCFEQDLETGEISDELSAGDCDDLQDEALPDLFIQRCFDINLIPTLDFTQIESILDKQQIQEIESPLKTNSIEICIDGTYSELAGDFFKDFKLLLNPIGQEFSEGGDFCEITEFGLDCDILFLNVADADPLIDAKTIKDILDFVTGIPSAASDTFTDITDDLGDLFDCIILDVGCA